MKITELIVTALAGFLTASSGFWVYLRNRDEAKNATTRLLMGLAHDKITFFGMQYIDRGFVTKDEYEDLRRYFYEPYIELGGNGTAERIMAALQLLPLTSGRSPLARTRETDDEETNDHLSA